MRTLRASTSLSRNVEQDLEDKQTHAQQISPGDTLLSLSVEGREKVKLLL